jgi:hypothetical protein
MERLRGKIKADVPPTMEPQIGKRYAKRPKDKVVPESRTIDILIREFKASAGNFEQFHSTLNGKEKILFKGYINSMRNAGV